MQSSIIFNLVVPQFEGNDKPPAIKVSLEQAVSLKKQLDELLTKPLLDVCNENKGCDVREV